MDSIRYQFRYNLNGNLELDLRRHRLVAIPSSVFRYPAIKVLILQENFLEYLPRDIAMLASLSVLQLQKNRLMSIPREITYCRQLQYLDLTSNNFISFPQAIIFLKQLKILKIANNQIKDIPYQISYLDKLCKFDIHKNNLQNLPNSMANLKKLKELDLSQNLFEQLPPVICSLCNTKSLNFSRNLLTYIIPCMDNLKNLQELNVSYNNLMSVCLSMSKLKKMKYLNLSYNQLTEVPTSLQQLPYLRILHIQGNKIKHVPNGFTSLMYLNLSNNQIYNFTIGKMKNLLSLNISHNRLSQLPHGFYQLKRLEHLIVNDNQIKSIPYEIVRLKHLRTLDISNNRLTSVPPYIPQITSLEYFNTENCNGEQETNSQRNELITAKKHFMKKHESNLIQKKSLEAKSPKQYSSMKSFTGDNQYTKRKQCKRLQCQTGTLLKNTALLQYDTTHYTMPSYKAQAWNNTDANSISNVSNQRQILNRGNQWLHAYSKSTDSKRNLHTSDSTSGFADEIEVSIASDVSSNDPTIMTIHDWLEPEQHRDTNWPTVQFNFDETISCGCSDSNATTANPRAHGLVKVFKEIFSITQDGGEFVSSDNSNISLNIPSDNNVEQHLQVIMQVISISEDAILSAQIQDPLLNNILSVSVIVMLTPNTDVPFTIPITINLPAPPTLEDNEVSGCLHVLTAKNDNTCTPFFRNYTLENGYITLQTYHLAGKVAVMTRSKCQYKACKCTESLLMMILS
ncbi:leucine-rich repeat and death domain-containing protein 1 isoform X1 [Octopus bimaculoides]|uniref:Uncharacterized protein n=1 Tax=Octopus bimaculoides TaxID=37653 RepID=A0A0L8HN93_OCTBM|nr:leucine-rich repeat and death domain-containing protein 1 isoform X1 [Octopus bimaculoides]|eukprot:XP_014770924.1 PREDICTED: leucine-rich repeat and death domain-containing protein 1-like isoform X1 [Octopus bimaculoides]